MAQRQASSTNDHLTIAGLVILGVTSALVGALVVAPTLAPKRMALAMELPEASANASAPKLPEEQTAASIPDETANAPGNKPGEVTDESNIGNEPGEVSPDTSTSNGPEEGAGDTPVVIRKPGEIVGPAVPPDLSRLGATDGAELKGKASTDRRTGEGGTSVTPDLVIGTGGEPGSSSRTRRTGERPNTVDEPKTSDRGAPTTLPSPPPDRTQLEDENDAGPDDEDDGKAKSGSSRVYRVQSGKFNSRDEALRVQLELAKSGKNGVIVPAGDGFRLQLGVFRKRENAEKAADTARQQNIIVDVRPERQAPR